jgi:exo-1,4-beta-D-glucosaminidase
MRHEAAMLQPHPSVLGYLIGSDYWPDPIATPLYLAALRAHDWQTPVIASASARGFSNLTGPSGMKMDGPYDWVPPNYWYASRVGAAFGFGSELGAGVGTPGLSSLRKFLSPSDLSDLWTTPNKSLFHMSREGSQFQTREIYNAGLWARWGAPTSLEDYLIKAQLMDYEATRAQVEAHVARWSEERPATGMIYWMLNGAWPSLHWNIWDYYMRPAGSYFGAKVGGRGESVVYDYVRKGVVLVNRSLERGGMRKVEVQVMGLDGRVVYEGSVVVETKPNSSGQVSSLVEVMGNLTEVVFLKLVLSEGHGKVLSRNVYWLGKEADELDWENSEWYVTPVSKYADFTALNGLAPASVEVDAVRRGHDEVEIKVKNLSGVPAFFVSFDLVDGEGRDVLPITWEDNYVTIWPGEKMTLRAKAVDAKKWEPAAVQVTGKNVKVQVVDLARV